MKPNYINEERIAANRLYKDDSMGKISGVFSYRVCVCDEIDERCVNDEECEDCRAPNHLHHWSLPPEINIFLTILMKIIHLY